MVSYAIGPFFLTSWSLGPQKNFPGLPFHRPTENVDLICNCAYSAFLIVKDYLNFISKCNVCNVGKITYPWKLSFTKVKWEKIEFNIRIKRS